MRGQYFLLYNVMSGGWLCCAEYEVWSMEYLQFTITITIDDGITRTCTFSFSYAKKKIKVCITHLKPEASNIQ